MVIALLNSIKMFFYDIRIVDVIDIAVVYYILYRILCLIKGTRAIQMLTGIVILSVVYVVSIQFGLVTLNEILSRFFNYLFLIVIILFQEDIRKALTNVGKTPFLGKSSNQAEEEIMIDEIIKSCIAMSRKRIGALIVLEKSVSLKDFIEIGVSLDTVVNAELVVSIFVPSTPIHDGAVIIKDKKIVAAGCFLPLTRNSNIDKSLGTRHRAGIGISEVSDAIVLIVSEEQREVSIAINGELLKGLDGPALRKKLYEVFGINITGDVNV